jgi:hypothetical protein
MTCRIDGCTGRHWLSGCLSLSPQQNGGKDQEKAKDPAQIPRRQRHRNEPTGIAAQKETRGAQNSRSQIDIAILPVLAQSPEPYGRQQNEQRCALGGVLVVPQQVHHRRHKHDAATDPEQPYKYTDNQAQTQHHQYLHKILIRYKNAVTPGA